MSAWRTDKPETWDSIFAIVRGDLFLCFVASGGEVCSRETGNKIGMEEEIEKWSSLSDVERLIEEAR